MWWMCVCLCAPTAIVHITRHIIMIILDCGSARRFIPFVAHMWMRRCNFFCWFDRISERTPFARRHNHFYCGNERCAELLLWLFISRAIHRSFCRVLPSIILCCGCEWVCVCVVMPDFDKLLVYLKNSFCVACTWLDTWSISISLWANRFRVF